MHNDLPIGVFDSGMGGVSVLKTACDVLPNENFIYFGDDKNSPYGTKDEQTIFELSKNCVDLLINKGVKAIVIACNTATSVAVERLRDSYDLPIISMEPAVKVGLNLKSDGKVLVMATPATISQKRYHDLVESLCQKKDIISMPCDGLVELIETGDFTCDCIKEYITYKLQQVKDEKIDSIVLGCTHYVFVKDTIIKCAKDMGFNAVVVDGNLGTARHLKNVLDINDMQKQTKGREIQLFTSGDTQTIIPLFEKALSHEI